MCESAAGSGACIPSAACLSTSLEGSFHSAASEGESVLAQYVRWIRSGLCVKFIVIDKTL